MAETIKVEGATFNRVMGESEVAGSGGTLFTYTVFVQQGLEGVRRDSVAAFIDKTLADERGWIRGGEVRFKRVERGAGTYVYLAKPGTVDRLCAPLSTEGQVSCCIGQRVVFNYDRWMGAVPHWKKSLTAYRTALVNHEWGHRTGHGHSGCLGAGQKHPIMMQFTYSFAPCTENSWPLDYEL